VESSRRSSRRTCALVLVLGACGEARAPLYRVADRAAGAVLGLDAELCVVERLALVEPRLLAAAPDGLWAACATRAGAPAPQRLARVERRTGVVTTSDGAALVALCTDGRGSALVLEHDAARNGGSSGAGDTLLWRVAADHGRTLLGAFPSARALAAQPGAVLVGCAGGELVLLRADGAVLALARGWGPVHALARGPRAGTWWSLEGDEERTLRLLERDLAPIRSARVAPGTSRFAAVERAERVWIAAGGRVSRLGPEGADEVGLELPPGPWEVALATGSGVLLQGPGALLEVEVLHGVARVRRAQGGFALLAALVPE
jgi:hypothetical protein